MRNTNIEKLLITKNSTPKNILIAEDDKINVFFLEHLLLPLKFNLVIAENGKKAVEEFKLLDFDLVLMDLYMPVMNGKEASKQIRVLSPTIPIIVISAALIDVDMLKEETGITHLLNKPFDMDELIELINEVLPN